jgi:diacylglycerol kinase family enzyme
MKPFKTWDMIRILFRGLAKTLDKDPSLKSFNVETMTVELPRKFSSVSLDGEMLHLAPPFTVRSLPKHLLLVKP